PVEVHRAHEQAGRIRVWMGADEGMADRGGGLLEPPGQLCAMPVDDGATERGVDAVPGGEGRAERLEGGRQRRVGRRQAGPQRVASAGWYLQGLQDPEPRGNLEPAHVCVPRELRRRMGGGVLDPRYRLLRA